MKASELIKQLDTLIKLHGDQDVTFPDISGDDDDIEIAGIAVGQDKDEKPYNFLICDEETLLAFLE